MGKHSRISAKEQSVFASYRYYEYNVYETLRFSGCFPSFSSEKSRGMERMRKGTIMDFRMDREK